MKNKSATTILDDLRRNLTDEEKAQLVVLLDLAAGRARTKRRESNNRIDERANDERSIRLGQAADFLQENL